MHFQITGLGQIVVGEISTIKTIHVCDQPIISPSSQFRVLFFNSKAVTCLQYGTTGNVLISGSEDGMVRVWDARTYSIIRVFKHAKGNLHAT